MKNYECLRCWHHSRAQVFSGINGLLIPGGAVSIFSSPYAEAATYLVDLAKLSNSAGEVTVISLLGTELETGVQVFPVWGTCLGFEMLAAISCGGCDYRH